MLKKKRPRDVLTLSQWKQKENIVSGENPFAQGAYGQVFHVSSFEHKGNTVERVILKRIYGLYGEDEFSKDLAPLHEELDYAMRLGTLGIGPRIFKSAIVRDDKTQQLEGVLVMEGFDMNLETYEQRCPSHTQEWVSQLHGLFCSLAEHGIMCFDLKASNVVVNGLCTHLTDMRLIDFGVFCHNKEVVMRIRGYYPDREVSSQIMCITMLILFDSSRPDKVFTSVIRSVIQQYPTSIRFLQDLYKKDQDLKMITRDRVVQWDLYV
jgi:hypothetical protein